jgi:hypothetical protein
VEYRIAAENAQRFVQAMQERRRALMRTGAFRWGLFNDTEDQTRFVETFLSESWAEHVRQHKRITNTDREADAAIEALQMGSEKPVVRHLIYTDMSAFT